MGTVRYIGSKARLSAHISQVVGSPQKGSCFVDLFSGTGIISKTLGLKGWPIVANDFLVSAATITTANLLSHGEIQFKGLQGYKPAIDHLNKLTGISGFFFREYSSSKENALNQARPYFSIDNAKKIDAIRLQIMNWFAEGIITNLEKTLLLADLIAATNKIANISGTYGCFLKQLSNSSLKPLILHPRSLHIKTINWQVYSKNAFDIDVKKDDTVYIDPPYTKRQYAAYYHIPETIANEDSPEITGITGLRPWKDKSSSFCYKTKVKKSFENLISQIDANRILISYSSDGQISYDNLLNLLQSYGKVEVHVYKNFARYSPNSKSVKNSIKNKLEEYLFDITRS